MVCYCNYSVFRNFRLDRRIFVSKLLLDISPSVCRCIASSSKLVPISACLSSRSDLSCIFAPVSSGIHYYSSSSYGIHLNGAPICCPQLLICLRRFVAACGTYQKEQSFRVRTCFVGLVVPWHFFPWFFRFAFWLKVLLQMIHVCSGLT